MIQLARRSKFYTKYQNDKYYCIDPSTIETKIEGNIAEVTVSMYNTIPITSPLIQLVSFILGGGPVITQNSTTYE